MDLSRAISSLVALGIPFGFGVAVILQAGLNRRMAVHVGIGWTTLINTLVLLSAASVSVALGWLPRLTGVSGLLEQFRWWHVFPGLCGFVLVAGLPTAVARWGALHTFLWLIASQLVLSQLWDAAVEAHPITSSRVLGSMVALLGAWIASR